MGIIYKSLRVIKILAIRIVCLYNICEIISDKYKLHKGMCFESTLALPELSMLGFLLV